MPQSHEANETYGRYSLQPRAVDPVKTRWRRIVTALPVPESLEVFRRLARREPRSMHCQPPILWDHASGAEVHDRFGNCWIDWSSGVLVANVGHGHPRIRERVRALVDRGLLATYVFAHEGRAALVERLVEIAPAPLERVFLLTTGAEAVECTIKLMRAWGRSEDPRRRIIVSFEGAFHGRTLGAQLAGGIPALKEWIGEGDLGFAQVPFPDGYRMEDVSFDRFERSLEEAGIPAREVAGVISETYLGIGPDFMPREYARRLRAWCDEHRALLAFDEVQAGFGRTGKLFGFEHYGVAPDLIACGKGISSSLPLSAVLGRADVMDQFPPGAMTSTHSGSPLCVAASHAALDVLLEEGLVKRAARLETELGEGCRRIAEAHPSHVGCWRARGLVGGIRLVRPGTREPDPDTAFAVVEGCFRRGLLLFSPVGLGGGCLKICPPLSIERDAIREGFDVLAEAFGEVLK